jgi:16S rRNA C1402 N4-methylase RsmH
MTKSCILAYLLYIFSNYNKTFTIIYYLLFQRLLDMTFGAGGHTKALLESGQGYHIYTLDRDPLAYKIACELAEQRYY